MLFRSVFEHRGLYALMARIEPDVADAEFGPVMRETLDLFAGPLTTLGVAPADMLHALRGLRAVMHGFVLLELGGQFRLAEDPEVSYAWVVEAAIRGLEAIR